MSAGRGYRQHLVVLGARDSRPTRLDVRWLGKARRTSGTSFGWIANMKEFLKKLWKDEEGAEVVEWVLVAAGLAAVAVAVYATTLKTELGTAMGNLSTFVGTNSTPNP
jgi:Flp pilus assembly pilin Flp